MTERRPALADFRHLHRLRVRRAEVDAQQVVFNGHCLADLDAAVCAYWRAMALPYGATLRHFGGELFVRKATLEYHASARSDDLLDIGIRCERIGRSSLVMRGALWRDAVLLAEGELVYVFTTPAQTPQPVPAALRELFEGYERGDPVLQLRCGDWSELGPESSAIREAVFVQEQGLPATVVWDAADATALHAVARNRLGLPLAAGRMVALAPGHARIGRMASLAALRGGGAGRAVLGALLSAARARGDREVLLHAQRSAVGFYARQGFAARGAPFMEAGLEHQAMVRAP